MERGRNMPIKRQVSVIALIGIAFSFLFYTGVIGQTVWADAPSFYVAAVPVQSTAVHANANDFDVLVKPGQNVSLTVTLTNATNRANEIQIQPTVAQTNASGAIDVGLVGRSLDSSLTHPFTKMYQGPKVITLAAHETRNVNFYVQAPKKAFSGTVIGGLQFSSNDTPSVRTSGSKTFQNKINSALPIRVRSTEPPQATVAPNLDLGEPKIIVGLLNHPAIGVRLRNIEPAVLRHLTGVVDVYDKNSPTNSFRFEQGSIEMAPNSYFSMQIPWGTTSIAPGNYTVTFRFSAGVRTWKFTRTLVVSPHRASELNQITAAPRQSRLLWWVLGGVLALTLSIAITVFVWHRGKHVGMKRVS
jgi:hypothetical protein